MRLSRIQIQNFRNFRHLDLTLGESMVVVSENCAGKSNLIHALRLVLDSSLPDSARTLNEEDFWDGLPRPLAEDASVRVDLDIVDFEDTANLLAILGDRLLEAEPMVARLSYECHLTDGVFEFAFFGGGDPNNHVPSLVRRRISMDVLPALRDAERDLENWRRSPLRPLLDRALAATPEADLEQIAIAIGAATDGLLELPEVEALDTAIEDRMKSMVGPNHSVEPTLGLVPTEGSRLLRSLKLLIDDGRRGLPAASVGAANVLYLSLHALKQNHRRTSGEIDHSLLVIEEPEAHLHPHLQRLVYRDFLDSDDDEARQTTNILTTHSPHIASIAPPRSICILRRHGNPLETTGTSAAAISLSDEELDDITRYLDVTRAELLFAKGVILVEGDAEKFLLPTLASAQGYNLDELGISICSICGTHFDAYVKYLHQLKIPFVVLTDLDPANEGEPAGHGRARRLVRHVVDHAEFDAMTAPQKLQVALENGIFLNSHTLEIDLFLSGLGSHLEAALTQSGASGPAITRCQGWSAAPATLARAQFLKDAKSVGKGRLAQRLASAISDSGSTLCPDYIKQALEYVAAKV